MYCTNTGSGLAQIVLATGRTTKDMPWSGVFSDLTVANSSLTNNDIMRGNTNGTSPITILSNPASGILRYYKYFTLLNEDTGPCTVTIQSVVSATTTDIISFTLQPGDMAIYEGGQWSFFSAGSSAKTTYNYPTVSANQIVGSVAGGTPTGLGAQVINSIINPALGVTLAGTNTYTGSLSPAPAAYYTGMIVAATFTNGNTGASTINLNSLGAKNIFFNGSPVISGQIVPGSNLLLIYDGTQFEIIYTAIPINQLNQPIKWEISGGILSSITGSKTTATFSVSACNAVDSTGATVIPYNGSPGWAVTNGTSINGSIANGTLANSTAYHVFVCQGTSGVGLWVDTSLGSPSLPTGYTSYFRRINSFRTDSSGNPLAYTCREWIGGSVINYLSTDVQDVNTTVGTGSRTLLTLTSLPTGLILQPLYRALTTSTNIIILTSPDEPDIAPVGLGSGGAFDISFESGTTGVNSRFLTTNTSSQIGGRANSSATAIFIQSLGWIDPRRA